VIVKTDQRATSASIIWSAAMPSASPDTTNNQAEYVGALEGLRVAHEHSWIPLDVVGDSQLILRQLSKYHTPRNERLSHPYAQVRRLGDLLGVRRWIHHLRGFNKMADAAANIAKDTQTSSQVHHPTTRVQNAELERHLGPDFAHWQAQHFARLLVQ
jgi:ribonuclease HI